MVETELKAPEGKYRIYGFIKELGVPPYYPAGDFDYSSHALAEASRKRDNPENCGHKFFVVDDQGEHVS